jgi:hypothetical protein
VGVGGSTVLTTGVTVEVGVGVDVGVNVGVGVTVGVRVGVDVGVGVGVDVGVCVGVGVAVAVNVEVGVCVNVGVAVGVRVSVAVDVAIKVGVGSRGTDVGLAPTLPLDNSHPAMAHARLPATAVSIAAKAISKSRDVLMLRHLLRYYRNRPTPCFLVPLRRESKTTGRAMHATPSSHCQGLCPVRLRSASHLLAAEQPAQLAFFPHHQQGHSDKDG